MTDHERYADPELARRVRAWVEVSAPPAAPERLVYAVMDAVEAEPARRSPVPGPRFRAVLQYVALTIVVAVGVAIGTRIAGWGPGASSPSPSAPSPSAPIRSPAATPTASPSPAVPSLATIDRFAVARAPGPSAIGVLGSSLWIGTPDGEVVELDASSHAERSRASVGAEPITILPFDGVLWIGSDSPDLAWLDPSSHEVRTIPGAGGHVVLSAAGSLWVSRQEEFLRLDPVTRTVAGSISLANHRSSDVAVVVGDQLWAGAGPSIVRLELPSGRVLGTTATQASAIVQTPQGVFAVDRGRLVRLSGGGGADPQNSPAPVLDGLPLVYGQVTDGTRVWLAGPMPTGSAVVVELDISTPSIVTRTTLGGTPRALAMTAGSLWVALDNGTLAQLRIP